MKLAWRPISYLHVFPYSRRPGTLAGNMPHQIPGPVKEARVQRLRALDEAKRQAMYANGLGKVHQVLVERRNSKSGLLQGLSENYIPMLFNGATSLIHTVVPVHLTGIEDGQPMGSLTKDVLEENP